MGTINANAIKAAVVSYWRYSRQCPIIALEASARLQAFNDGGQADVLAVNNDRLLIETEVKLDMGDFRRDREKPKHSRLRANDGSYPTSYFYLAVPREIANRVCLVCDQIYPYAGVLGVDGLSEQNAYMYREAKRLKGGKLTLLQTTRMAKAQSATLCRLARALALRDGNDG